MYIYIFMIEDYGVIIFSQKYFKQVLKKNKIFPCFIFRKASFFPSCTHAKGISELCSSSAALTRCFREQEFTPST